MNDTTGNPSGTAPGGKVEDLDAARQERAKKTKVLPATEYRVIGGRLCRIKHGSTGEELEPLCNFTAEIAEEVRLDDGRDVVTTYRVQGMAAGKVALPAADVEAGEFGALDWVPKRWGQRAVIRAGQGHKDHVRAAILTLSRPQRRTAYTHIGWTNTDGGHVYLHAGGAVGAEGLETRLDPSLSRYRLPDAPGDPQVGCAAVRAVLGLLRLAPLRVMWPILAQVFLAPLCEPLRTAGCEPGFVVWLYGPSGAFKSSLAALAQSFWGDFPNDKSLPADFRSTANHLERIQFSVKDALLVVDDFRPELPDRRMREQMAQTADALIRGQGNRHGRGRMHADTRLRPGFEPRGLVLATGEDLPQGESTVGRLFAIAIQKPPESRAVASDTPAFVDPRGLTMAQKPEARLDLRFAMRGYLDWLRPRMPDLPATLREDWQRLGQEVRTRGHTRLPDAVAHLQVGARTFLRFAAELGALDEEPMADAEEEAWAAILEAAGAQAVIAREQDPTRRFFAALAASVEGGRVRVSGDGQGGQPEAGAHMPWVGEIAGKVFYLASAARAEIAKYLRDTDQPPLPTERMMNARLEQAGLIAQVPEAPADGGSRTVLRTCEGRQFRALPLRWPADREASSR